MHIHALPKVELHRHLAGSIRLETAFDLAKEAHLPVPARSPQDLSAHLQVLEPMDDLGEVLEVFQFIAKLFTREDHIKRIAREVVLDAARENIKLLELRFSPDYLAHSAGLSWDRLTGYLLEGVEKGREEAGDIEVGLIAIVSRNLGVESAEKTADYALRWKDVLCGFDLADDERAWPSRMFVAALQPLEALGLPLTVHSGEATGPEYVKDTLESLRPRRLGHGIAVAADDALVEQVIRDQVAIEACPTSNVRTRSVPSFEAHPAKRLLDRGVRVTLNTDDPGLFDLTLTGELEVARESMGFTDDDLRTVQHHALRASFLPLEVRQTVADRYFDGVRLS